MVCRPRKKQLFQFIECRGHPLRGRKLPCEAAVSRLLMSPAASVAQFSVSALHYGGFVTYRTQSGRVKVI